MRPCCCLVGLSSLLSSFVDYTVQSMSSPAHRVLLAAVVSPPSSPARSIYFLRAYSAAGSASVEGSAAGSASASAPASASDLPSASAAGAASSSLAASSLGSSSLFLASSSSAAAHTQHDTWQRYQPLLAPSSQPPHRHKTHASPRLSSSSSRPCPCRASWPRAPATCPSTSPSRGPAPQPSWAWACRLHAGLRRPRPRCSRCSRGVRGVHVRPRRPWPRPCRGRRAPCARLRTASRGCCWRPLRPRYVPAVREPCLCVAVKRGSDGSGVLEPGRRLVSAAGVLCL